MPGETKNYNDTPKEYEFKQKFDKLQKARDFWIDMIKDKKVKTPQKLMDIKSKVDLYSKQMRDVVEKNKTQKLDTKQAKYYKEMSSNKVEKEITDVRFNNLFETVSKSNLEMSEFDLSAGDLSKEVEINSESGKDYKEISIKSAKRGIFTIDFKRKSLTSYIIRQYNDGSYKLIYGGHEKGEEPYGQTDSLNPDQANQCLDQICNRISKITKYNREQNEEFKKNDDHSIEHAKDFAQLDQQMDQALKTV